MIIALLFGILWLSATTVPPGIWLLAPNVGMALTLGARGRTGAWPHWIAFLFGLLQDVVYATPLGTQALVLVILAAIQPILLARAGRGFFPQWALAAVLVVVAHCIVWLFTSAATGAHPPLMALVRMALATILWYPLAYLMLNRLTPRTLL
jgi:rod shape-determining protein MreD